MNDQGNTIGKPCLAETTRIGVAQAMAELLDAVNSARQGLCALHEVTGSLLTRVSSVCASGAGSFSALSVEDIAIPDGPNPNCELAEMILTVAREVRIMGAHHEFAASAVAEARDCVTL